MAETMKNSNDASKHVAATYGETRFKGTFLSRERTVTTAALQWIGTLIPSSGHKLGTGALSSARLAIQRRGSGPYRPGAHTAAQPLPARRADRCPLPVFRRQHDTHRVPPAGLCAFLPTLFSASPESAGRCNGSRLMGGAELEA